MTVLTILRSGPPPEIAYGAVLTRDGAPIMRANGTARTPFDLEAPNFFNWGSTEVVLESDHAVNGPFRLIVDIDAGITPPAGALLLLDGGTYHDGIKFPAAPQTGEQTISGSWGVAADPTVQALLLAIDGSGRIGAQRTTVPISLRAAPLIISAEIDGSGFVDSEHIAEVETDGSGVITVAIQWFLDGEAIVDETAATYTPGAADAGRELTFEATASSEFGTFGPSVSAPIVIVAIDFAIPGLVAFSASTGTDPGEIDVIVLSPLPDAGDGAVVGDGSAVLDRLEYRLDGGPEATLTETPALDVYTIMADPGATVQVGVRAVSDFPREGEWAYHDATAAGDPDPTELTYLGGLVDLTLTAGDAWSVDWDTYWSGATSYLVNTGATGGVSSDGSSTRDLYSVAALVAEDVIVSVTASVASGTEDTRSFRVLVEAADVAPSLVSAIEERFVVPRGASVAYDMSQHFAGTDLVYSSPDDDANFAITAAGSFRSLVPLTGAIATHTRTITATNGLGSASDTISVGVTASPMLALATAEINVARSVYEFGGSTWRRPQARLPGAVPLVTNPFSFTNGSTSVTVSLTAHRLAIGQQVILSGATAAAGLTIAGTYAVTGVPDKNSFRITAAGTANATTTGGGAAVLFRRPTSAASLAASPFAFTSGQSAVTVTWAGHPAGVGRVVEFNGATAAAGLTIDGAYLVTEYIGVNSFKIDAGANASSTTSGGGSAVTATLRPHNAPLFTGAVPLATVASSTTVTVTMPGHHLAVGRPITLAGFASFAALAASNINGDRTVTSVPAPDKFTFTAGAAASSTSAGGGSTGVIRPRWSAMKWARGTPDANGVIPDDQSEETPNAWEDVGEGLWEPHMEDVAKEGNPDFQSPRTDYGVWFNEANDTFRLAVRETPTALWALWSSAATVPLVPEDPVETSMDWIPLSNRTEDAFDHDDPDSRGLQFERVVAWYTGSNPDKLGWVLGGQDENGIWISKDFGRSWKGNTIAGLYCSQMAGLYLDDDVLVAVGNSVETGNWSRSSRYAGFYIGDPDLQWAFRLDLTRPSSTEGPFFSGSSGVKRAFVRMANGSSGRISTNCVARRPQTGGLSHAQRPIWVIEQQLPNTGGDIIAIYVWKVVLSGRAQVASATMVRELPLGTYASGDLGVHHVQVAPNGDVMLIGKTGVFLSDDEFATAPTKIYPSSGNRDTSAGYFFGGSASTPSGARIGVYTTDSNDGVWATSNVRTTNFTKPTGAGGVANAGLPGGYRVAHMGMAGDVLAVCTDGQPPYRSTDGGKNFSKLPEPSRSTPENFRYLIRTKRGNAHTAFHPCPANADIWLILTNQTMVRSTDRLDTINPRSVVFFDGMHIKGVGFGRNDWKQTVQTAQDSWVNTGLAALDWGAENQLGTTGTPTFKADIQAAGGGGESYLLGNNSLMTPSNRVIASCSRSAANYPNVIVVLDGRNSIGKYSSYKILKSGITSKCFHSKWSPKGGGVGFLGRWAVSDTDGAAADVTLRDHAGHEFIDCALDGGTLVSFWGNYGVSTGTAIYRSTNDLGDHGAAWYTLPGGGKYPSRAICMDHHHGTLERVLYVDTDSPSRIREVKKVSGGFDDNLLVDLFTMPDGVKDSLEAKLGAGAYIPEFEIIQLLADPFMPGLFYALGGRHGMPNWWRTLDNGVKWENISTGLPMTIWLGYIHQWTGDVIASSSLGSYCLPPPPGYPAITNRAAASDRLRAFYAKPTVADPPV